MKRDYRLFIRDILEGIENIEYFIGTWILMNFTLMIRPEVPWSGR